VNCRGLQAKLFGQWRIDEIGKLFSDFEGDFTLRESPGAAV